MARFLCLIAVSAAGTAGTVFQLHSPPCAANKPARAGKICFVKQPQDPVKVKASSGHNYMTSVGFTSVETSIQSLADLDLNSPNFSPSRFLCALLPENGVLRNAVFVSRMGVALQA